MTVRRAARVRRVPTSRRGSVGPIRRDVLDVSLPPGAGRPRLRGLASLAGAAAIALVVALVIALAGLAVDRAGRGIVEAAGWLWPGGVG